MDVASRGRIRLRSADPRWHPAIDPGYLSDEQDLEALTAGVRLAREIVDGPLPKLLDGELLPGAARAPTPSCATTSGAARRPCTTRSAPARWGGDGSVVDLELRVRGVTGCGWSTPR